ncbi:MAG: aminotransferase [Deltaproteobacteria bacterium]|nr:aminotransferase [Deltaproteobacteria bacterium]
MSIDIRAHLPSDTSAATNRAVTEVVQGMQGSQILAIATAVRAMQAEGKQVCNLTVGDFKPTEFPVPERLVEGIQSAVAAGQTNYPPSDGLPVLRQAIADFYKRDLGLDYGPESVVVCSGARPVLYGTWRLFTNPGDKTVSFLPAWNVGYYAHLNQTDHHFIRTSPETNFFPTVEQVKEVLPNTRLMVINSPLNPTGTVIDPAVLQGIAQAIVDENNARGDAPPCMLMWDAVYWQLTKDSHPYKSPVQLVPEVAPYVIHIDAISKAFAATGLRVGWAVMPPYLQPKMKALIGHMGAWAARPEQLATAALLNDAESIETYNRWMKGAIDARLDTLYDGISAMKAKGLPVDAIAPQGAIYLSFRVKLEGKTNEDIRALLLNEAGMAVVPFQAFDLNEDSGWFRISIGAVGAEEIAPMLKRLEATITKAVGA